MYFWLGIFCLKQGFKSSAAQLCPNIGRVPYPVFVLHPLLPHQPFPSAYSSAVLSHVLVHVILTLHQHLPFSLSLLLLYLSVLSSDWPLWVVWPRPWGLVPPLPRPWVQPDSVWVLFSLSSSVCQWKNLIGNQVGTSSRAFQRQWRMIS